jgi:hypothetical protein
MTKEQIEEIIKLGKGNDIIIYSDDEVFGDFKSVFVDYDYYIKSNHFTIKNIFSERTYLFDEIIKIEFENIPREKLLDLIDKSSSLIVAYHFMPKNPNAILLMAFEEKSQNLFQNEYLPKYINDLQTKLKQKIDLKAQNISVEQFFSNLVVNTLNKNKIVSMSEFQKVVKAINDDELVEKILNNMKKDIF